MAMERPESLASGRRRLDQREAPFVEALERYLSGDYVSFCIPAHKQGRSLDPETLGVLGAEVFRHDVGMLNGTRPPIR